MTVITKELFTLPEFLQNYSISRTTAYREVAANRLKLTKVGSRSYVSRVDAESWLKSLRGQSEAQS